jgi:hypothetical protein
VVGLNLPCPGTPLETVDDIKMLKLGQNLKIKKVSSLKSS